MKRAAFAVSALALVAPGRARAQEPEPGQKADEKKGDDKKAEVEASETRLAPLQAREVIERLKTLRAQILLDEEYNRLLEIRVKRMELEEKLTGGTAQPQSKKKGESRVPGVPPPPSQLDLAADKSLVVKSVTVAPFKEAFVVYKGRTYTVRPGDSLGDIAIRDITQNGVVTNKSSVMLEP